MRSTKNVVPEFTSRERDAIRRARNEYARRRRQRNASNNQPYLDRFYLRKAVEYGFIDVDRE